MTASSRPSTATFVERGRRAGAALFFASLLSAGMASVLSCGAEGAPAPFVPGVDAPASCPTTDEALARTTSSLTGEERAPFRALLREVLGERGGIKVLLQALFALLRDTDARTFEAARALPPAEGLGALGAHLTEVLRYFDGSGRYEEPHPEPLSALHAIVSRCEAATTWRALAGLLALDVRSAPDGSLVLVPYGEGERAWLAALLEVGQQALDDPEVEAALARVQLDDEGAGGAGEVVVGRAAFQLLFHIVAANLAAPQFDPVATRRLIDDALLVLIDSAGAKAAADRMLDVLFLPMDPHAAVFRDTQALVSCVDRADDTQTLAGMLFDWMTVEGLSPGAFIDDLAAQAGTDAAGALRPVAIELLSSLASRPSLAADTARIAGHFLSAGHATTSVRLLLDLKGRGVVFEILSLLDVVGSCR